MACGSYREWPSGFGKATDRCWVGQESGAVLTVFKRQKQEWLYRYVTRRGLGLVDFSVASKKLWELLHVLQQQRAETADPVTTQGLVILCQATA